MTGRSFFLFLALAFAAPQAISQQYPARAVRLIVASSPGSGVDIVSRIMAQKLSTGLGQQVIVDNRAGAGANLGAEIAARSPADGYTLLMGTPAHVINVSLYSGLNYDVTRDFAPVSLVSTGQYVVIVHPSVPARTAKQLIALGKANPGALAFGSAGPGNSTHLAGELFNSMAQIKLQGVPYKGSGPVAADVLGGQVPLGVVDVPSAIANVKAGKIRALAVTSKQRIVAAPEVPTFAEAGLPGYEAVGWFGTVAPAGTPSEIVNRLNLEIKTALSSPEVRERALAAGAEPLANSPQEFAAFIRAETRKWSEVIKAAGVKLE